MIDCDHIGFGCSLYWIFGDKYKVVLLTPSLEQVFERFTHDGLTRATADLFDEIELLEVVVDEELAHAGLMRSTQ